eukprot:5697997-Pyramimonas_sp.AAC.1
MDADAFASAMAADATAVFPTLGADKMMSTHIASTSYKATCIDSYHIAPPSLRQPRPPLWYCQPSLRQVTPAKFSEWKSPSGA